MAVVQDHMVEVSENNGKPNIFVHESIAETAIVKGGLELKDSRWELINGTQLRRKLDHSPPEPAKRRGRPPKVKPGPIEDD